MKEAICDQTNSVDFLFGSFLIQCQGDLLKVGPPSDNHIGSQASRADFDATPSLQGCKVTDAGQPKQG
jgi:hypothetical protein